MIGWHGKTWVWFRSGYLLCHQWFFGSACSWVAFGWTEYWAWFTEGLFDRLVAMLEGIPVRDHGRVYFSALDSCTWGWFSTSVEALMTQLVNLTNFTLRMCALSSDKASRRDWLASKTISVSSNAVNVASASSLLLSYSSSASINACSFLIRSCSCSRRCFPSWVATGQVLAFGVPCTLARSFRSAFSSNSS